MFVLEQLNLFRADMAHTFFPRCALGVYEARCVVLSGAAEGETGHWLAGPPTGCLFGTSCPSEISQTQGTYVSVSLPSALLTGIDGIDTNFSLAPL